MLLYASSMPPDASGLPDDLAAAHAMIRAERAARLEAEAQARAMAAEPRAFVGKPFRPADLLRALGLSAAPPES